MTKSCPQGYMEVRDKTLNLSGQSFPINYEHSRNQVHTLPQTLNYRGICFEETDLNNISIFTSTVANADNNFNINEHIVPVSTDCSSNISYRCKSFPKQVSSTKDKNIIYNLSSVNNLQTEVAKLHGSHQGVDDKVRSLSDQAFAMKYEQSRRQDETLPQTHNFQGCCFEAKRDLNNISIPTSLVTKVVTNSNINDHSFPVCRDCYSNISCRLNSNDEIFTPENFHYQSKDCRYDEIIPSFVANWDNNNYTRESITSLVNEPTELKNECFHQSINLQERSVFCESNIHESIELSMSTGNNFQVPSTFTTSSNKRFVNSITQQLDSNVHRNILQRECIVSNILRDNENIPDTREFVTSHAPIHLEDEMLQQLPNLQDIYFSSEEDTNTFSRLSTSEPKEATDLSNIAAHNNETNVNQKKQSDNGNAQDEISLESQQFINNYFYPELETSQNSNSFYTKDTNMAPTPSDYDSLINTFLMSPRTEIQNPMTRLLISDPYYGSINNKELNETTYFDDVNTNILFERNIEQDSKTPDSPGAQHIRETYDNHVFSEPRTPRNADIAFEKENKNVSMFLSNKYNNYNENGKNAEIPGINSNFKFAKTTFHNNKENKSILSNLPLAEKIITTSRKFSFGMQTEKKETKQIYSCPHCSDRFVVYSELKQHVFVTHKAKVPHGDAFTTKQKSVTHMRSNSEETSFSCEICKEAFSTKRSLTVHLRIHKKEKLYACMMCNKAFSYNCKLLIHVRVHTKEKPYACEICDNAFSEKGSLTKHMRIHTKEKPYACEICNKAFSIKSNLTTHMRIHSNEKPYACETCNKAFSSKNNLAMHLRIHSNEKPFGCKICKKAFSRKYSLTRHMRIHSE